MSKLNKTVKRETDATVFERSKLRNIIVSIEPTRDGALIGLRQKGNRDTYRLPVGSLYVRAVENHLAKIERKAKQIAKAEGKTIRAARAAARVELKKDLR
jgi:hypothetical protein